MRMRACAVGLILACLSGCWFSRSTNTSTWLDRFRPLGGITGSDVVVLDHALLETPIGDTYINQELWTGTDEQFLSPEVRTLLEENGLRLALVHGRPPNQLQTMLGSERYNRNGRQRRLRTSDPTVLDIGSLRDQCAFDLKLDSSNRTEKLQSALCQLQLLPTFGRENKVHLQFTPQMQHHDADRMPTLSPTSSLPLHNHRVTDAYAALRFAVDMTPNEYLVIGARFDKPKSLGFQFFVQPTGDRPVQRLLVLRVARGGDGGTALDADKKDRPSESPSLASQACLGR
jgi:hypothetical protein